MSKILIIEDNLEVRENTAEILELAQYKVITAENGKTGVELAIQGKPDLIICDIMMPVLDGYGVLHMLSKNPETAAIPFIFLTAKSEKSDYRKGMELGADDYITKPFDDTQLLNAIEIRLRKSAQLKKSFSADAEGMNAFMESAQQHTKLKLTDKARQTQSYKKKFILYQEGHRPQYLYLVVAGKIKTYKTNEDGKEFITNIHTQGDFIGYTPILEDSAYKDNAEVLEEAQLMLIPREDFLSLISHDNQLARQFIKLLSHNIVENEERLINLAYNSVRKRVAIGLLEVHSKFKTAPNSNPSLEISREDLAQVVGTATESLIRTLSEFKGDKLIDIKEGKIRILEESKLRHLLG